jgi:hypothetical protein
MNSAVSNFLSHHTSSMSVPPNEKEINHGRAHGDLDKVPSEDPHHQKRGIELQRPFFGSPDCDRSNSSRFALFDRSEEILPIFDLAWINTHFLT